MAHNNVVGILPASVQPLSGNEQAELLLATVSALFLHTRSATYALHPFVAIGMSTLWFAACKLDRLTSLWAARLNRETLLAILITATRSELAAIRYGAYTHLATQLSCLLLAV